MMKEKKKWPLAEVMPIAKRLYKEFAPHCENIAVVGSVRRQKLMVSDLDIIIIPRRPFHFGPAYKGTSAGIVEAIDKYSKVTGELTDTSKQLRRKTPEGIEVDIWICNESNWGLLINLKTGPKKYNIKTIIPCLRAKGYAMSDNHVINIRTGQIIPVREENDLYKLMDIPYKHPKDRR